MPPGGSYNPAITLESILLSIQLLLASPNPDDPLRDDVSDEYRYNRELFNKNAKNLSGSSNKDESVDADNLDENTTSTSTSTNNELPSEETSLHDNDKSGADKPNMEQTSKPNRKRKHDET